jgi:hypothetical protein
MEFTGGKLIETAGTLCRWLMMVTYERRYAPRRPAGGKCAGTALNVPTLECMDCTLAGDDPL